MEWKIFGAMQKLNFIRALKNKSSQKRKDRRLEQSSPKCLKIMIVSLI